MRFFAAIAVRVRRGIGRARDDGLSLALPAAIGALTLALRLYGLGDKPFWLDEVASLRRATGSIPALIAELAA